MVETETSLGDAMRERIRIAEIYKREIEGTPTFLSPADMVRVAFAMTVPGHMEREVAWLNGRK